MSVAALVVSGSGPVAASVATGGPVEFRSSEFRSIPVEMGLGPVISSVSPDELSALEALTAWQGEASEAVHSVSEEFPNDYAGSFFTETSFSVSYKNQAPAGAASLLNAINTPHTVIENVGVSEVELKALTDEAHELVVASVPPELVVTTGFDLNEHTIDSLVTTNADAPQSRAAAPTSIDAETLTTEITESLGEPALEGFEVNVDVALDAVSSDTGYGQAGGNKLVGGGDRCTSGFVVKQTSGSELGILTAGHCSNTLSQIAPNGSAAFAFNFRGEHRGAGGDYQWMRSPVMMDGWFHYNVGVGRAAIGIGNAGQGQSLCKYGDTTKATCGTVDKTYDVHTVNGVTVTGVVRVAGMVNDGGDSGGPVFNGGRAYGLVKGNTKGPGFSYYYHSPIAPALNQWYLSLCLDAC